MVEHSGAEISPMKRALLAIEDLREKLRSEREAAREPIAIIGLGCRYPGGVSSPDDLWSLLAEGRDAIGPVPRERWDAEALYDPDPDVPGKSISRCGGFLRDIDRFDAGLFGITPREAAWMDPQHRLLLETTWEALEHAGIPPSMLRNQAAGVFVGLMYHEYETLYGRSYEALDGYVATGSAASVASGRISYLLGLKGPSLTLDTACSSSLVAVHLAAQSLRAGECELAIAGGVTLMLTPALFVEFSRLRGLAPDGRCKSFDAAADGTGWSEGCGVIVLKRLARAIEDGDRILAVVRGSAVNQDGRSSGLTTPNGPSQEAVIRRALDAACLPAAAVQYVETHGTGTQLGDPIEAIALGEALGAGREPGSPLLIGSVKSNIGHTQAAAGAAGILKVVLAMRHEMLPASLHLHHPSPHIPWEDLPLEVVTGPTPWPRGVEPRIAGVSSFGIGGTNAHVILEEPPAGAATPAGATGAVGGTARACLPLLLAGRSAPVLRAQAGRLAAHLESHPGLDLTDVASTLAFHRTRLAHRAGVVAHDRDQARAALQALADEGADESLVTGIADVPRRIVFVFPGQGSQWPGMASVLSREVPVFREALEACDAALQPLTERSILEILDAGLDEQQRAFERVDLVQPALLAMSYALARTWQAWGVRPAAVIGQSQGEVAAACIAGALSEVGQYGGQCFTAGHPVPSVAIA